MKKNLKNISLTSLFKFLVFLLSFLSFAQPTFAEDNSEEDQVPSEVTEEIIGDEEVQDGHPADYDAPSETQIETGEAFEVIRNVDQNGQTFDPRVSFPEYAGQRQFLTFRTSDNQLFHIIVTYGTNSATVQVLEDVASEKIGEMSGDTIPVDGAPTAEEAQANVEEKLAAQEKQETEESEQQDTQESDSGIWFILAVVVLVGGFGIYRVKQKKDDPY